MRIRPGKTRSLIAGIVVLIVAAAGLFLLPSSGFAGGMFGDTLGIFKVAWLAVSLIGAGLAFYNAFARRGVALYEVESDVPTIESNADPVCPKCGKPVGEGDRFCRSCGAYLRA